MDNLLPGSPEDLSGLKIRKMTLEDLNQVVAIDQISFSLPWPQRSFYFELTDNPTSRCWVAEFGGRMAAMMVAWFIVDELHIATIAVHPDFRGRGIGKALLLHSLQAAKQEGALTSFLEVRAGNEVALAMYHKFGYVEVGRRKEYYKDNHEDAILMTLESLSAIQPTPDGENG